MSFQIKPEALQPEAKSVVLEIDGQSISYSHKDQARPVAVTWPGSVGFARVQILPEARNVESTLKRDGPWAWFRLLDAAEVRRRNTPDRKGVNFIIGGRIAIFELQTSSVLNPFALPALTKFSCPKSM